MGGPEPLYRKLRFVAFTFSFPLIGLTVVGVPNGGAAFRTLPAFLAVGIPVEGLVLLHAVRDINDYSATVANTTGQFAAATILSKGDRTAAEGDAQATGPVPSPASG